MNTCNNISGGINDNNVNCKTDLNITEKDTQSVTGNNDKKEDNILKSKRLPKMVKVKPKLKTRTNVCSTTSHYQEEPENNIMENKNIDVNKSRTYLEIKHLDDSKSIESSALSEETFTNDNSHNCETGNETGNSLKMQITSDNEIGRCDSNDDYDSFSEGEMVGKQQLISKNKVFKPNLGTKRRERLSSFSAYSLCDEDDLQNQNKRKKENAKKASDDNIDKAKKGDKKKRPKHSVKLENNRENLEPNTKRLQKKQKRPPKTDTFKLSKYQEERDISSLTMQELIHYNHPSFKTVELRSKRDADENEHVIDVGDITPTVPCENKPETKYSPEEEEVMAPQIMINEDGEIVINQESLTINQKVDDSSLNKNVVYEDSLSYGAHLKRKHVVGKRWNIEETLRFYKALSEIGTDFTLMSQAFRRFSRNELKKKFKKEEKVNCDLVDRALSNRLPLNMEMFLIGKEEMKDIIEENQDGD